MKYITKKGNRVYKRNKGAKHWSFKVTVDGKAVYFNLGKEIAIAKKMADEIDAYLVFNSMEDTILKYNPNKVKGKAAPKTSVLVSPTLGDIVDFLKINKPIKF